MADTFLQLARKVFSIAEEGRESSDYYDNIREREATRHVRLTHTIVTKRSEAIEEVEELLENNGSPIGQVNDSDNWEMIKFSFEVMHSYASINCGDATNRDYEKKELPRKFRIEFKELEEGIQTLEKALAILKDISPPCNTESEPYVIDFGSDDRKVILKNMLEKYGTRAGSDEDGDYFDFDDPFIEKLNSLDW